MKLCMTQYDFVHVFLQEGGHACEGDGNEITQHCAESTICIHFILMWLTQSVASMGITTKLNPYLDNRRVGPAYILAPPNFRCWLHGLGHRHLCLVLYFGWNINVIQWDTVITSMEASTPSASIHLQHFKRDKNANSKMVGNFISSLVNLNFWDNSKNLRHIILWTNHHSSILLEKQRKNSTTMRKSWFSRGFLAINWVYCHVYNFIGSRWKAHATRL